ncbi:ABC transporter permease [Nitratidesulfovibrio sp. SRB-5]|uniref:ABC transporter permease n=1 Tax=Nitratidesulfovibrio sp. SRB-5 TaxID=2872636 RepID=UPI00102634D4|nr:ABC transporter permease [Nitratidesulfovibrio sp. SRB-5]MBZ2173049.1 ABC transporter permease [Nitratidesulfovibrio sp. SRB-5]RXF76329.1 ABC transporter permease [Desulfovibrio sp. DS-1]
MASLFSYSLRNMLARRLTTALTVGGMALVVFVFAAMLMLSEGLRTTLVLTGSPDNVVLLRQGAKTEMESSVDRDQAPLAESLPQVARAADGGPLAARELVVLITLNKRGTTKPSNVVIRGIGPHSLELRPQVKLKEGRMPRFGTSEIIAGESIARRFSGTGIGESLRFGLRDWTVVGIFEAGATGFSSEVWGDADQLMAAFRRSSYSVVVARMNERDGPSGLDGLRAGLAADPRLQLEGKRETRFYEEQSEMMAKFLGVLGTMLPAIFSLGAIIGAMITMHAAVANRVREIGTLRAIGFQRRDILRAFLLESLLLGASGGGIGLLLASTLQWVTISTMNFQTFSELAFSFTLSPRIAVWSLLFGTGMGCLGGILPAIKASRLVIVDALRAA